jgi:hypothetical protein
MQAPPKRMRLYASWEPRHNGWGTPPEATSHTGCRCCPGVAPQRMEAPSRGEPRRTETPAPTGIPAPPPGTGTASRTAPGKCNCPVCVIGLPWMHDHSPGAEATWIHESGAAAFGWPYRRSGCRVNASRHLPAAAQGKVLPGGFHLLPDELAVAESLFVQAG